MGSKSRRFRARGRIPGSVLAASPRNNKVAKSSTAAMAGKAGDNDIRATPGKAKKRMAGTSIKEVDSATVRKPSRGPHTKRPFRNSALRPWKLVRPVCSSLMYVCMLEGVYVYVCLCVYLCSCVCVCVCVYVCICFGGRCARTHTSAMDAIRVCMYMYMYTYACMCMYTCMYVYVCMYMYTSAWWPVHTHCA